MYSLRNLLNKAPNVISAAIFATVNFVAACIFVATGVDPSPEFAGLMLSGNTALVLVLNLFVVQPNTETRASVNAKVEAATQQTRADITEFLNTEPEAPPARRR